MMKTKLTLVIIAGALLCLYACKKSNDAINLNSIVGKWNVLSDSTYAGVGIGNHPVNYNGQPGDYFNIMANGTIYTKEGLVLDTLSYHLVADTGIVITAFGVILNGTPSVNHVKFTGHNLVITSPTLLTPGGIFWRKTSLSR
jgi:hypothetical protein